MGPNVALFVDRWLRRAQRTSAAAARRKAQLEAQAAIEDVYKRQALATIASTTDPEMFLIGGGVARAGDVLFDPLVEHFKTDVYKRQTVGSTRSRFHS